MTPLVDRVMDAMDRRLGLEPGVRERATTAGRKVFPAHWSFLLGEVSLITFAILVVTGIILTVFYTGSTAAVTYEGSAVLYQGREVPAAFASILELSHDVPSGLLVRRIHRAASHLFVAAVIAHMLRVVLTGAFRPPRRINHVIGVALLALVVAQGWIGHNLPFDALAGTAMRIAYTFLAAIPWVGPDLATAIYGGQFPTSAMMPRAHILHVLILPLAIVALIGLHMQILLRQSHTQRPRTGVRAADTVVGERLWPSQAAKTTTLGLAVLAVLAGSAVLIPWSDVDLHGPFMVGQTTNAAQPDWFLFWVEGALRLYPGLDIPIPGGTLTGPFVVGVVLPLLLTALLAAYPWIEPRLLRGGHGAGSDVHEDRPSGDAAGAAPGHHGLQHPMDVPVRAGLVAGMMAALLILTVAAASDVIARLIGAPIEGVVVVLRVLVLTVPPVVGLAVATFARRQHPRWREPGSHEGLAHHRTPASEADTATPAGRQG